jgi:integrase
MLGHEGVPMEDIQKWLGHSSVATTESFYAHFDEMVYLLSVRKVAEAFGEERISQD